MKKILFIGESWSVSQTHTKGYDHVVIGSYVEYGGACLAMLKNIGLHVDYMPSHIAHTDFPFDVSELKVYDVVILSDVGSNTFLLHPDTQKKSVRMPNRLEVLKQYVREGGGLLTIGGYMSYSGIEGKARYAMTPLAEAMPVEMLYYDDRVECPEGVFPVIAMPGHPVLKGIDEAWPFFLGYNRLKAKPEAELIASVCGDVFMAGMQFGRGRSFSFASDCVPHWAPPEFVSWKHYGTFFNNVVCWLSSNQ